NVHLPAFPDELDVHRLADIVALHRHDQFVGVGDLPVAHAHDHIALDDPGVGRRATRLHIGDFRAAHDLVGDRFLAGAHPDHRVVDRAVADEGLCDLGHLVDGDREAEPDRTAALAADRGVDTDDPAVRVHQRATGVTGVDGGVGLHRVDHGLGIAAFALQFHGAMQGAD